MRSFHQDRLVTNTGKTPKDRFSQGARSEPCAEDGTQSYGPLAARELVRQQLLINIVLNLFFMKSHHLPRQAWDKHKKRAEEKGHLLFSAQGLEVQMIASGGNGFGTGGKIPGAKCSFCVWLCLYLARSRTS
eukprot:COSAG06_NODE_5871_length_3234_cov_1.776467_1_plen_132_part_00